VTETILIVQYDNGKLQLMRPITREEYINLLAELRTVGNVEAVEGVQGIAVTDPHWDSKPTFRCGNCEVLHDVHENVAQVLFQRSTGRSYGEKEIRVETTGSYVN
jgi:hypothetical protein